MKSFLQPITDHVSRRILLVKLGRCCDELHNGAVLGTLSPLICFVFFSNFSLTIDFSLFRSKFACKPRED